MRRTSTCRQICAGIAVSILVLHVAAGCATRGFVRNEVAGLRSEVTERTDRIERETAAARNSAEQAYQRAELAFGSAEESRLLALGHFGFRELARQSVGFAFDSNELDPSSRSTLDELGNLIRTRPDVVVDIYGFTDPTGSAVYNLELGKRRAEAVLRYLADQTPGPLSRYAAISFGEERVAKDVIDGGTERRRVVVSLFERVPPSESEKEADPPQAESYDVQ